MHETTDAGAIRLRAATLLAAERAVNVGARMLRDGRSHVGALIAKGDRDFATAVDLGIEETIRRILGEEVPGVPFLGEEEGGAGCEEGVLWVLDPIDGTVNFTRGSTLCAISLALLEEGQPALAVVDLPLMGERYVAARGAGAYLNGQPIAISSVARLDDAAIGMADFAVSSDAEERNRIQLELVRSLAVRALRIRVHGSEAVDLAWLAAGRLDAALMLSNLPWDVSGGILLAREAGGVVFDGDGSPHTVTSRYTLASTPGLREPLVEVVSDAIAAGRRPSA